MNNFLAALGALLVVALTAMFAVPHFVDWNQYRGVIEEETTRVLGRDFRIGGDVRLRLLPTPSFRLEQVQVADPQSASGMPLFKADTVSVRLAITPLLRGALEATEIELVKPVVRLVLNERGGGTWQTLGQQQTASAYLPSSISLNQVTITGGTLSVVEADGMTERLGVDHISGDLSAVDLKGPYKFRGTAGQGNGAQDVRLQANAPEADGSVRVAATLKAMTGQMSSRFEGFIKDISGAPRFEGQMTVQAPLPRGKRQKGDVIKADGKAAVVANAQEAAFADVEIAFESTARPQLINGQARWTWGRAGGLDVGLSSAWLDLDTILGVGLGGNPKLSPVAIAAERLGDITSAATATGQRVTAVVTVGQANFGGDQIGDLTLKLASDGRVTNIEDFSAQFPGGSRADFSGTVTRAGDAIQFQGATRLKGTSVARLATWASGGDLIIDAQHDGPFSVEGLVRADGAQISVQRLTGTVASSVIDGAFEYTSAEAGKPSGRRLMVDLSGPRIDARALLPHKLSLISLLQRLSQLGEEGSGPMRASILSLRIRAGTLVTTGRVFRDAVADVEAGAQGVRISRLHGTSEDGARVAIDGKLSTSGKDATRRFAGTLNWSVAADDGAGLQTLLELIDAPQGVRPATEKQSAVLPLKIAGAATFGAVGSPDALTIDGDGVAGAVQVHLGSTLSGGIKSWASQPLKTNIDLAGPDRSTLARLIGVYAGPAFSAQAAGRGDANSGDALGVKLSAAATGIPSHGLLVSVRSDGGGGQFDFQGRLEKLDSEPKLSGVIEIDAAQSSDVLALVPGVGRLGSQFGQLKGRTLTTLDRRVLALDDIQLAVGDGHVNGALKFDLAGQKVGSPQSVTGQLAFNQLSVTQLLTLVTERSRPVVASAISVTTGRAGVWPDQPFNFDMSKFVNGSITLSARSLTLSNGLGLTNAKATLSLSPTGLAVTDLSGQAAGGTWTAGVSLEKSTPAGAQLTATLGLAQGALDSLGGSGPVSGTLRFSGRGLSPSGLVSTLTGNGSVALGASRFTHISAPKLKLAMEKALNAEPDKLGTVLKAELDSASAIEPVTVGPRQVGVEIKDGLLKTVPFQAEGPDGKVTPSARVDLSTLVLDGEWRVESKVAPAPVSAVPVGAGIPVAPPKVRPNLPGVVVSFKMPLQALGNGQGAREMTLQTDALERELSVRKVERDLEELERLRLLDELRVKERARQQLEDAAQRETEAKAQSENAASAAPAPIPAPMPAPEPAPTNAGAPPSTVVTPPRPQPAQRPSTSRPSQDDWKQRALGVGGG